MRKKLCKKLLIELLRDSKQNDRKLAKKLRVSQPTITELATNLNVKVSSKATQLFPTR